MGFDPCVQLNKKEQKYSCVFFNLSADIDECSSEENPCHHQCDNTAGSFRCLCTEGFRLSEDQHSCQGQFVGYILIDFSFQIISLSLSLSLSLSDLKLSH